MGSMKLDLRNAPNNFDLSVDKYFDTAFGPSLALYRRISLCGWRPLLDHPSHEIHTPAATGRQNEIDAEAKSPGIAIYETADRITIEVTLTIIKEESLHLAISNKKLIIRGERIQPSPGKSSFSIHSEQSAQFQHLIPLPESVRSGGFRAQLKGHIVQIEFAKQL